MARQASLDDLLDDALRAERWAPGERPAVLDAIGMKKLKKSGAPVRRNSRRRGREGVLWRPVRRADLRILVRAAEKLEKTAKQAGKHNGPIGHVGLEVLRELARLVDFATGRLEPAYATIAANIGRSRSAVIAAIARLRRAGFLDWARRYEETGERGSRGPQVKQISNAYRFALPAFLARLLGHGAHGAPLPEDEEDRARDARRARERWAFEESPLFSALQRLGRAIDQRESETRSETPSCK